MDIKIWEKREDAGISLIELERKTGISKSTLNNYENGKTSPTLYAMEIIASALNCRITELFDAENK